jgi:succinate dehydrogenase flavin-adding protein (antitoxin of CptAB toxin-antitoxin module)
VVTDIELDTNKVDSQYEKLKGLYQRLSLSFSKLMSKYMAHLDDKQQKDFIRILKEENHKLSQQKSNEQMQRVYDRFKMIFGTMSENQKSLLKGEKKYLYQRHQLRLERRKKLHERFSEIYQMDMSTESLAAAFYEAFADYQKNYPDDVKNKEIIKAIIPTLSNAQKGHFEDHLKDLREILGYYLEADY